MTGERGTVMSRSKSNYDGLQEVNEQRLIGQFFNNVDDTITDEKKIGEQLEHIKTCFTHCMFPNKTIKNKYHYL